VQDGENNRAKANRETHRAPGRFVSDATISFVHHIRLQSVDGLKSVDGLTAPVGNKLVCL